MREQQFCFSERLSFFARSERMGFDNGPLSSWFFKYQTPEECYTTIEGLSRTSRYSATRLSVLFLTILFIAHVDWLFCRVADL